MTTDVFIVDKSIANNPVTDEERATVIRDVLSTLEELPTTEEPAIHVTQREVYVMMVLIKENQDALLEINKSM